MLTKYLILRKNLCILFIVVAAVSCHTVMPEQTGIINYGKQSTFFSNNQLFEIKLPNTFRYNQSSLSQKTLSLIGRDTCQPMFYAVNSLADSSKNRDVIYFNNIICLYYPNRGDLSDFSKKLTGQLAPIRKGTRYIYEDGDNPGNHNLLLNALSPPLKLLFKSNKINIIGYNYDNRTDIEKGIIEYHVLLPDKKGILRFILESNDNDKSQINLNVNDKINTALMLESASLMSTLKIEGEKKYWKLPIAYSNRFFNSAYDYSYLLPIQLMLRDSPNIVSGKSQVKSVLYQTLMTQYSFSGQYDLTSFWDSKLYRGDKDTPVDTIELSRFKPVFAEKFILSKYANSDFLLFNEAHHLAQTRAFVRDILPKLYEKGFRYLALETLDTQLDTSINRRGYAIQESGFYTPEPVYGQLVRTALKLGFKIIAYEDTVSCNKPDAYSCINQRDLNEAKNIISFLQKVPKGKTVVFAGYAHILKSSTDSFVSMAQNLKKLTGITPISIDQTLLHDKFNSNYETGVYKFFNKKYSVTDPAIFVQNDTVPYLQKNRKGALDAEIFLPKNNYTKNTMPQWVFPKNTEDYTIRLKDYQKDVFLQLYYKNEFDSGNSIPYFNAVLKKGIIKIKVKLEPDTEYIYVLKDVANNLTLFSKTIISNRN